VRARSRVEGASAVDRRLAEGSLLVSWLNRGTLHLVRAEDFRWLHLLTAPRLATTSARRLAQEGVSPAERERGVALIVRTLAEQGPQRRERLREVLEQAGVPTAGQALVHLLLAATLEGLIVRGPPLDGRQAFVLAEQWLGPAPPIDRDAALAELARRYLAGHGPAGERDLARWAALPLRDVRRGLDAIAAELRREPGGMLALATAGEQPPRLPPPRLLGPFDPLLHGWVDKRPVLGETEAGVVTTNGIFRPIALVRGRAAAIWRLREGTVALEPFAPLGPRVAARLERDAAAVLAYLAG
jgi:hypothetical protein